MCLAIPAEVLSVQGEVAACRVNGGQTTIRASLMLLPSPPQPGEYLIVHAGFAMRVLNREQAAESLRMLDQASCAPTGTAD